MKYVNVHLDYTIRLGVTDEVAEDLDQMDLAAEDEVVGAAEAFLIDVLRNGDLLNHLIDGTLDNIFSDASIEVLWSVPSGATGD